MNKKNEKLKEKFLEMDEVEKKEYVKNLSDKDLKHLDQVMKDE